MLERCAGPFFFRVGSFRLRGLAAAGGLVKIWQEFLDDDICQRLVRFSLRLRCHRADVCRVRCGHCIQRLLVGKLRGAGGDDVWVRLLVQLRGAFARAERELDRNA